jgi:Predicted thioesterase involved in non-ribosomal peptide biosynthesis
MTKKATSWLAYRHPNLQAQIRLFCFPYAGGGASIFGNWFNFLPAQVEVCPIQLPGRENRINEPPIKRLSALVDELIEILLPLIDLPFAFFGHSMGALISFELTRLLRQSNLPLPSQLFISGFGAPHMPDPEPPIHHLPLQEFVAAIRRHNGTPEEVWQHEELVRIVLPYLRADFEICETYVYQPDILLPIPITVYGGRQDPGIKPERLRAWSEQTTKNCIVHMFLGDHFFLYSCREQLMMTLSQELMMVRSIV